MGNAVEHSFTGKGRLYKHEAQASEFGMIVEDPLARASCLYFRCQNARILTNSATEMLHSVAFQGLRFVSPSPPGALPRADMFGPFGAWESTLVPAELK